MKEKYLSDLTVHGRTAMIIAQLKGGRAIVRVEKPRSVQWWRVGPYLHDLDDNRVTMLSSVRVNARNRDDAIARGDVEQLRTYQDRIAEPEEVLRYLKQAALELRSEAIEEKRFERHNRAMTFNRAALIYENLLDELDNKIRNL